MGKLPDGVVKILKKLSPKHMIILGAAGVMLIMLSGMFTGSKEKETVIPKENTSEYAEELESKVVKIVKSVTGENSPTVVVTLDTGTQYVYAGDEKEKSSNSDGEQETKTETRTEYENEKNYVIVKQSSGDEAAVIVTEYMPVVRGVAIVCHSGCDEYVREEIKNAVTAALGVNSAKIYITGSN